MSKLLSYIESGIVGVVCVVCVVVVFVVVVVVKNSHQQQRINHPGLTSSELLVCPLLRWSV